MSLKNNVDKQREYLERNLEQLKYFGEYRYDANN